MSLHHTQLKVKNLTLYEVVFGSIYVKLTVVLLFIFLLFQPIAQVMAANEQNGKDTSKTEEKVIAVVDETPQATPEAEVGQAAESGDVQEQTEEAENDIDKDELITTETENIKVEEVNEDSETPTENIQSTEQSNSSSIKASSSPENLVVTDNNIESSSTTSSASTSTLSTQPDNSPSATTTESGTNDQTEVPDTPYTDTDNDQQTEELDEPIVEKTNSVSTTSDIIIVTNATNTIQNVSTVTNDENRYQFSKNECRAMASGAYYCNETDKLTLPLEDAIFSAPDNNGDLEIFVRIDGIEIQLTDNLTDDSEPYYDSVSERIVWQSLINDRYQIMSYNLNEDKITQITNTSYNNMQPVVLGDLIFWQAWIENNWEIVRLEGDQVIQMTDNKVHDIAPYAQDNLVMWQTQNGEDWKISLYDLLTDKQQYIDTNSDGFTKNPRMVLMYESMDANGDVQVMGYDFKTKEHIVLSNLPNSVPKKLPRPEGDQEKSALIQSKPTPKNNGEDVSNEVDGPNLVSNPNLSSTTSATSTDTLIIPKIATSTATSSLDSTRVDNEALLVSSSTQAKVSENMVESTVEHIPDLIIPKNSTSSDEVVG